MPGISCKQQFRRFCTGVKPEGFFTLSIQQELNGVLEVGQTFLPGFVLSIRAGNFEARGPKTTLPRLTLVYDGCELLHASIDNPF